MITKNELEKYRGSKVGEALVNLSVAEGFKCEKDNILRSKDGRENRQLGPKSEKYHILVSISYKTFTNVSDIIKLLDFIKSNLKLQKEEPCLEIGSVMSDATGPYEPKSSTCRIDIEYWDTLSSNIL